MLNVFEFEVQAPRAMFARVDSTGGFLQSYPVPTPTGVEGLCTSVVGIHRNKQACMQAVYVKVCSPFSTTLETTNSHCISRKTELISKGTPQQMRMLYLTDQTWIFGVRGVSLDQGGDNDLALHKMFERYINEGKQLKAPCLGHAHLHPSYVGPVRAGTKVNTGVNHVIPDFLIRTYDRIIDGKYSPVYADLAVVKNGFLDYCDLRKANNVF